MCKSPLHIGNKSRSFIDGCHPVGFTVPCGKCTDCVRSYQDDWFVRAFFEYKSCKKAHGVTYFVLFTYKDEYLPTYTDNDFNFYNGSHTIPCFDPNHIKRFRDMLRINVERSFDTEKSKLVKYFLACEYGDTFGRPHIHALIFVPFPHEQSKFIGLPYPTVYQRKDRSFIPYNPIKHKNRRVYSAYESGIFGRSWQYGWFEKGDDHPWEVESSKGIKYVMKYIHKPSLWYKRYRINNYRSFLHFLMKDHDCSYDYDKYKEKYDYFRRLIPRHYQSQGFGSYGLDLFYQDGKLQHHRFLDRLDLTKYGHIPNKQSQVYLYNIPRYYYNKCFYNIDPFTDVRYLNPDGLIMKNLEFDRNFQFRTNKLSTYYNLNNFISLSKLCEQNSLSHFLASQGCFNIHDLYDKIFSTTLDRPVFRIKDLALYDMVYRRVNCSHLPLHGESPTSQLSFFYDNAFDFYQHRFHYDSETTYESGKQPFYSDPNFYNIIDGSQFACFDGFDKSMSHLDEFISFVFSQIEQYNLDKDDIISKLQRTYKPNSFISTLQCL